MTKSPQTSNSKKKKDKMRPKIHLLVILIKKKKS